jgi:large subunit ribosomal protein L22
MQVKATSRYVRVAPNKARQVVQHIRGLGIDEARRVLQFSPKDVSEQILKTLNSAVANAEHNNDLDADDLVVTAAVVDEGPMLKRFQPRAMGRAYRIRKRTSHITIAVGVPARVAAAAAAAPPSAEGKAAARRGLRRRAARGETGTEPEVPAETPVEGEAVMDSLEEEQSTAAEPEETDAEEASADEDSAQTDEAGATTDGDATAEEKE